MNFEDDLIPLVDEIELNIKLALDSIYVCEEILAKSKITIKDRNILTRNVHHLQLMLCKPWFVGYLEPDFFKKITDVINRSQSYIITEDSPVVLAAYTSTATSS